MDAEKFFKALNNDEAQELVVAIPESIFREEAEHRVIATGSVAIEATLAAHEQIDKTEELQTAQASLDIFAERLHPENPDGKQTFVDSWQVNWDKEANQPVIYKLDEDGEVIFDCMLDLSERELEGDLLVPKYLYIAELDVSANKLTTITELPDTLVDLYCGGNQLTALPELPEGMTKLVCDDNQLTGLPELPDRLSVLFCGDNQLTTLPRLPDALTNLYCGGNQLTTLPELPEGLIELKCQNNELTTLPVLPDEMKKLDCTNNQLTALPELPKSLGDLTIFKNPFLRSRKRSETEAAS